MIEWRERDCWKCVMISVDWCVMMRMMRMMMDDSKEIEKGRK